MTSNDDYVLEVIEEDGLVTPEAIAQIRENTIPDGASVVDMLISHTHLDELEVLSAVAGRFGMDVVSLADTA